MWQMYWRIVLPVGRPILFTLFLVSFLGTWNQFLWPVLVVRTPDMQTLSLGMATFYGTYKTEFNKIMAGSLISLAPILVLFAVFQKYIEHGLRMRVKL